MDTKKARIGVIVVALIAATLLIIFNNMHNQQQTTAKAVANIPSKSSVTVPEPDATDIEQVATNSIPTTARAGSQSHAVYVTYGSGKASGYLTYDASPSHPASFSAVKQSNGTWKIISYKVLSK